MQPLPVVEHFNVVKNRGFRFIPRLEPMMPGQLVLEVRKEALDHRIIIAVALPALALDHAMVIEYRPVRTRIQSGIGACVWQLCRGRGRGAPHDAGRRTRLRQSGYARSCGHHSSRAIGYKYAGCDQAALYSPRHAHQGHAPASRSNHCARQTGRGTWSSRKTCFHVLGSRHTS
jgi:hypothetical protein